MQFWPIAKKGVDFRWIWKTLSHLDRFQVEQDAKLHMIDFVVLNRVMPERELQSRMQGLAQVILSVVVQDRYTSEIARAEQVVADLKKKRDQREAWLNTFTERLRSIGELIVRKDNDVSTLVAQLQFAADARGEWAIDEEGVEAEREMERERLGIEDY